MKEKKERIKKLTVQELYNIIAQLYMGQIKRENFYKDDSPLRIYQLIQEIIKEKGEIDTRNKAECDKMYEIAQKFYELVMNKDVRNEIIQKNISLEQFKKQYREQIMNESTTMEENISKKSIPENNKRNYAVSKLFNPNYIKSVIDLTTGKRKHKIVYIEEPNVSYRYLNALGQSIIIQKIGNMYLEEWNGVKSGLSKYRIKKQIGENQYIENEVYTDIRTVDMKRPEYRDAILNELLSDENMTLVNANGYIGEIRPNPKELQDQQIGKDLSTKESYLYKVNDKYALEYKGTDLSAVRLYEQQKDIENRRVVTKKNSKHIADESR